MGLKITLTKISIENDEILKKSGKKLILSHQKQNIKFLTRTTV